MTCYQVVFRKMLIKKKKKLNAEINKNALLTFREVYCRTLSFCFRQHVLTIFER